MAQALSWHETEVQILSNTCTLLPTLAHFRLTNKEVEVMTEII